MPDSIPDEDLENDNEDKKVKIQRSYISLRKYLNTFLACYTFLL